MNRRVSDFRVLSRRHEVFSSLELGTDDELFELAEVATFGYPFNPRSQPDGVVFPAVTVRLNQISSLRKDRGELLWIQV